MTRAHARVPLVVRNSIVSLSGGLLPALVGVVGTGLAATRSEPTEAAVLLTVWTLIGYLSLTDFGLTRTASKLTAEGTDLRVVIGRLWRTSLVFGGCMAILVLGLTILTGARPWLALLCILPLAAALQFPIVGALEARGRFGTLALQRFMNATCVYLAPAVVITIRQDGTGTFCAILVIVAYRIATLLALARRLGLSWLHAFIEMTSRNDGRDFTRDVLAWVGLSSAIGPLLLYADRVVLGLLQVPSETWVFYVAVSELLIRTYIVPSAVLSVLFPWLARNHESRVDLIRMLFLIIAPLLTLFAAFGAFYLVATMPVAMFPDHLIGVSEHSAKTIVVLLAIGTVVNWSSQALIAVLHAADRQKVVTTAQAAIAVPYVLTYGMAMALHDQRAELVAAVWAARIVATWVCLWSMTVSALRRRSTTAES